MYGRVSSLIEVHNILIVFFWNRIRYCTRRIFLKKMYVGKESILIVLLSIISAFGSIGCKAPEDIIMVRMSRICFETIDLSVFRSFAERSNIHYRLR